MLNSKEAESLGQGWSGHLHGRVRQERKSLQTFSEIPESFPYRHPTKAAKKNLLSSHIFSVLTFPNRFDCGATAFSLKGLRPLSSLQESGTHRERGEGPFGHF